MIHSSACFPMGLQTCRFSQPVLAFSLFFDLPPVSLYSDLLSTFLNLVASLSLWSPSFFTVNRSLCLHLSAKSSAQLSPRHRIFLNNLHPHLSLSISFLCLLSSSSLSATVMVLLLIVFVLISLVLIGFVFKVFTHPLSLPLTGACRIKVFARARVGKDFIVIGYKLRAI